MAAKMGYYDSQMFDRDYDTALQLYSKMGQHIRSLASLDAAYKLKRFLQNWLGANAEKAQIIDCIREAALLYDKAELAGRNYARRARNFAEENLLTAQGVLAGKKHYATQDVLEAFEDMATGLLEEFEVVINKHHTIVNTVKGITNSAKGAEERARIGMNEAEKGIVRHAPIVAPFVGAAECAEEFANAADNMPMKVLLGFAGVIVGAVKGAITSSLLVPMALNIADKAKYKQMMEEFNTLANELKLVESVIKEHRELLAVINGLVKNLSQKYNSIQRRRELRDAMLDRIIKESRDLVAACDIYLQKTG